MIVILTLPFPPTTNTLYVNVPRKGRVKSEGYKAWISAAGWELKLQRPAHVPGRYRLALTLTAPDRRARDADNLIKAVSDLLKAHDVIDEDSLAKSVTAEWADGNPVAPGHVEVTVEPYPPKEV